MYRLRIEFTPPFMDDLKDELNQNKETVTAVYGDTWIDPYYDIIKDQARLNILENG